MMAFAGMNMAQNAGGKNASDLFAMGQRMEAQKAEAQQQAQRQPMMRPGRTDAGWTCSCGASGNTGKFCAECGKPRPEQNFWTCSCGAQNKGRFCSECGKPKPAGALQYRCDKCGWEPEDPAHPPKFCPECGDPFDAADTI